MSHGDSANSANRPPGNAASRAAAILLLLSLGAILESVKLSSLHNGEIWGHIQTGSWILQNKDWPHSALFSQFSNLHWSDFSWGYDVVAAIACQVLGLRAVPALLMLFRVALAAFTFLLARGRDGNFWGAVVLSFAAQFALAGSGPASDDISVIFLAIELLILMKCRTSNNSRLILALPVLFLVWTNLDVGFVYGIGLFALFLAIQGVEAIGRAANCPWLETSPPMVRLKLSALAFGASLVASLLNPYSHHAYETFWAIQTSAANRYLPGYAAMSFRQPQDYVVLLVGMTAFLSMGLRRSRNLFHLSLLAAAAMVSFHSEREAWLVTLAAVAVVGSAASASREESVEAKEPFWHWRSLAVSLMALAVVLLLIALKLPRDKNVYLAKIANDFPVRACDLIRQQQLSAPLFNSYRWGSFLTWYLPEYPVAIDGRRGLYPDQVEMDYVKVMNAEMPYQNFAPMKQAHTLLLDKPGPIGEALRDLSGFHVAYEDDISIVLVQGSEE
jgi:hypothetical protein